MQLAFVGFRHGHVMGLYNAATRHPRVEVVAACEEDSAAAEDLRRAGKVKLTHTSYQQMLDEVPCQAVAVGEYYAKRGPVILQALRRGKHVIADKPICILQSELEEIGRLARQKNLSVGCLLDLRGSGAMRTVRRLIAEGAIGEVHTVHFTAQHPLLYGSRPAWYFQPGMQGGTLNDIGIHAFDIIPWITGRRIVQVVAARAWNARLAQCPQFQDAAQMMLQLDNGGGVMGDVSYLAPDGCGYGVPQYWRMTFHGAEGVLECTLGRKTVLLARRQDKVPQELPADPDVPDLALESFLRETSGQGGELSPSTAEVLPASQVSLAVQSAADHATVHVAIQGA